MNIENRNGKETKAQWIHCSFHETNSAYESAESSPLISPPSVLSDILLRLYTIGRAAMYALHRTYQELKNNGDQVQEASLSLSLSLSLSDAQTYKPPMSLFHSTLMCYPNMFFVFHGKLCCC